MKSNRTGKTFNFEEMTKVDLKSLVGKEIKVYYKQKIKGSFGYVWLLILDENDNTYTYAPSANLEDLEDGFTNEECPVNVEVTERTSEKTGNKYFKLYW